MSEADDRAALQGSALQYARAETAIAASPTVINADRRLIIDLRSERAFAWDLSTLSLALVGAIALAAHARDPFDWAMPSLLAIAAGVAIIAAVKGRHAPLLIQADSDGVSGPDSEVLPRRHLCRFQSRRLAAVWLCQIEAVSLGTTRARTGRTVIATCRSGQAGRVVDALNAWLGDAQPTPEPRPAPVPSTSWPARIVAVACGGAALWPAAVLLHAGWTVQDSGAARRAEWLFGAALLTPVVAAGLGLWAAGWLWPARPAGKVGR